MPSITDDQQPRLVQHPARALLLSLLGNHFQRREKDVFHGREAAVAASTFVSALARVGVSEGAARATLARAVNRGLLHRRERGRRSYYEPTGATRKLLAEGAQRIFHTDVVRTEWDGAWTLLTFSLPESRRADRHRLRVRLAWAGFGPLRDGLWIAPGDVDVLDVITDLDVSDHVDAFVAHVVAPTDVGSMIAEVWDLDRIAAGYRGFLARWSGKDPLPGASDDLARSILLITDWRLLLVDDPSLPLKHLPDDWPAIPARAVFDRLFDRYFATGSALLEEVLETLDDPGPD